MLSREILIHLPLFKNYVIINNAIFCFYFRWYIITIIEDETLAIYPHIMLIFHKLNVTYLGKSLWIFYEYGNFTDGSVMECIICIRMRIFLSSTTLFSIKIKKFFLKWIHGHCLPWNHGHVTLIKPVQIN